MRMADIEVRNSKLRRNSARCEGVLTQSSEPLQAQANADAADAVRLVANEHMRNEEWSFLDVGCGVGRIMRCAIESGFLPVVGTEVVPALCNSRVMYGDVTDLPMQGHSADVVSAFEVLDHLPHEDAVRALHELNRVSARIILVSVSNLSSTVEPKRINLRPYPEWHSLFLTHLAGRIEKLRSTADCPQIWMCIR